MARSTASHGRRSLGPGAARCASAALLGALLLACRSTPELAARPDCAPAAIVVAGERIAIDAPVVLWFEPGGYSAYRQEPHFRAAIDAADRGLRYTPGRRIDATQVAARPELDAAAAERIRRGRATRQELAGFVDQFVLHYDVCGTSEVCFAVLQDERQLSVHFLLDLDGTIYQTLDISDQAWHAAQANPRSVGVEIAQVGAWPVASEEGARRLAEWYTDLPRDAAGGAPAETAVSLPERFGDGNLRAPERARRTATAGAKLGVVHGQQLIQYDFTAAQYASLAALTAALHRALPGLALDVPRDAAGEVRMDLLRDDEYAAWRGLLGHHHLSVHKTDPGPALRWDDLLEAARQL